MKRLSLLGLAALFFLGFNSTNSFADGWVLWDWSANINGATYNPPALPGSVSTSPTGFPASLALGSFTFTISNPGPNYVGVYLYPYYDSGFGDLSSAFAFVNGTLPTGVSYQMASPGADLGGGLTLFDLFAANSLNNTNTVGASSLPPNACCSVAVAEVFSLLLDSGETAKVTFTLSPNLPTGPYLQVTDTNGGASAYLTETASITGNGNVVPEPASILLLASGASIVWAKRRMLRRKA